MPDIRVAPPQNQLTDFSVVEDSTPVDPSDSSGGVGQFTLSILDGPQVLGLQDKEIDLSVPSQGITRGTVRSMGGTDGSASFTADSRLSALAVERTADPYQGTLENAFRYYLGLVGLTDGIVVDSTIASQAVVFTGWTANVWDKLKDMCSALGVEVSLVSKNVVLRPVRTRYAENYRDTSHGWGIDASQAARSIEIFYYNNDYRTNALAYPAGGWNPDVPIITVEAGETITVPIDLSNLDDNGEGALVALNAIQQPVAVDYVAADYTATSVYCVARAADILYTAAQWTAEGGKITAEINSDRRSLTLTITGANNAAYGPFSIAVPSLGGVRYSSLRLVGTGTFSDRRKITMNTSVDHNIVADEVGVTIENEYISTFNQAYAAGLWALKAWGSPRYTIDVSTVGINRLGDNGSYRYPTIAEFNAANAGKTIAQFNTDWTGKTIEQFNEYWTALAQSDFANQAFGNIAGARVRFGDAMFRIRSATNEATGITYTAEEDTTIDDFNKVWAGATIAQFNAEWAGSTMADFRFAPLRRA